MQIKTWPLEQLVPERDALAQIDTRTLSQAVTALRRYGWMQPILVDIQGVVISGEVWRLAAIILDMPTVPVHVVTHLSRAEIGAWQLHDRQQRVVQRYLRNRPTEIGTDDPSLPSYPDDDDPDSDDEDLDDGDDFDPSDAWSDEDYRALLAEFEDED